MNETKNLSLAELQELYQRRHDHWTERHYEILREAEESRKKAEAYAEKLQYIKVLTGDGDLPSPQQRTKVRRRRRRRSTWREPTLKVLRDRPGQRLSEAQIRTALQQEVGKLCSRQTVNNNVYRLEREGLILRERAPRGSGAQFVFSALPVEQTPKKGG